MGEVIRPHRCLLISRVQLDEKVHSALTQIDLAAGTVWSSCVTYPNAIHADIDCIDIKPRRRRPNGG